jgi:hypothetical protein
VLIKKLHDGNEELKGSISWMKSQDEELQKLRQKYGKPQKESG